ncbi:uncharacterized protein M6B38_352560 [Iris pallida]|uniref:Uncharacterized protein n=1 Tax=Iris pallida TaxID=29817 RepID=A0AAX6GQ18_IRIPA|nr:uncharacterized protein M6B38_352560 [Iris pallida]
MNYNEPDKKCSARYQDSRVSNEKISPPSNKRSMPLQEKDQHLKSGKPNKQSDSGQQVDINRKFDSENSFQQLSTGKHQKPWPSRKVTGLEEVVKNMASVPCYLQRLEKGDNVQEKALNFGVLDWGSLEKWTYLQKQVANRRGGNSPSSSNASSSPFSTVGSSSRSTRSDDSPLAQRKQSPTLDVQRNYPDEARRTKLTKEQNLRQLLWVPDSGSAHTTMSASYNHENVKCIDSDMKGIHQNKSQDSDARSSPTSKHDNTSAATYDIEKTRIGESREAGNSQSCQQKSFSGNLRLGEHSLQEQCSVIEGMWDHLQESVHQGRMSCDFAVGSKGSSAQVDRSSFSGSFPIGGIPFTDECPVSRSCPLPSTTQSGKPVVDSSPVSGKHGKHYLLTDRPSGLSAVNMADRPGQNEVKVPTSLRRELSPHRLLRAGINRIRNSSLREGSSGHQMKQNSYSAREDDEAANTRGRRSPLRRMLDPLMKTNNRSQFSGLIASSSGHRSQDTSNSNKLPIRHELELAKGRCRSSDTSSNSSTSQVTESASPVQDEKHARSTRHALLKLAWKNGLPLYMFSSNDGDIFAATMGKRCISEKNAFECIYTLFSAHETKKKGGVWTGQGSKIKKQGLVYNVVGQMKVSPSKSTTVDSKSCSFVREFVLFGAQLVPTGQPVDSLLNSELAAIVVKVPGRTSESSIHDALQSTKCCNSSQTNLPEDSCSCCQVASLQDERNPENLSLSSIVAILPSAVHGSSTVGEPSPLMERWKSGGSCDCGGWDEGCMLTVLTDKAKETTSGSVQSSASDGIHRLELFNQGDARAKEHVFTMVASKEGGYTVEFGPSIAMLQAFAICIATLHSRTQTSLARLHYSVEARSLHANSLADNTRTAAKKARGGSTNCVPDHPPLSPIRIT